MIPPAVLSFSGWSRLWPVCGYLAVSLLVLAWSARAAPAGAVRWICVGLKAAALAALGLCFLEPLWVGERARPGANLFAVLADNSQSLGIRDRDAAQPRGESLRALVDPGRASWLARLADNFEVRRYLFDARLQPTDDFHELAFDGRSTALGGALRALADRFQGRPLAGVLVLTDGGATDLRGPLPDLSRLPPVYPVVIGRPEPVRDIALERVEVTQTAFEDAPVSVEADVTSAGFAGRPIFARLTDEGGRIVDERTLTGGADGDRLAFRFQLKPDRSGLLFYQVRVGTPPVPGEPAPEATLANNARVLVVNRSGGPYRILYVGGHPGWEYKFLNRAAQEDKEIDLVSLIRIARSEPKFDFRGRAGETSNPLYRGFGAQAPEEVEPYDQPVFVRLNTRDAVELRSGFPAVPADLYGYQAIIVDGLEAAFFSPIQSLLVQKFVSERGGGFLMLGGAQSFQEGRYARTPIGDLLPVYLDGPPTTAPPAGGWRLDLTREGLLQPWARLRDNEAEERARRDAMPGFSVVNRVRGIKPGASLIAALRDPAGAETPGVVTQRFGRGRSAAVLIGDLWRWGLVDEETHRDLDKSWRQLLRWLVADVPNRVELAVEPQPDDPNNAVRLQVRVRDAGFQPLEEAAVTVEVQPVRFEGPAAGAPDQPVRLTAEPSPGEPGLYEATYVPRLTGGYRARAIAANAAGAEVGRAEAGWSADLAADEFHSLTPNAALLAEIARRTGGRIVAAEDLDAFVRRLPNLQAPVMEAWSFSLWHTPEMFGFALACLLAEWGLRRRKGLA